MCLASGSLIKRRKRRWSRRWRRLRKDRIWKGRRRKERGGRKEEEEEEEIEEMGTVAALPTPNL